MKKLFKRNFKKFNMDFLNKIFVSLFVLSLYAMPAFAGGLADVDTPGEMAWMVIRFVFSFVGPVLVVFGAYKIAMGFGQDKPEEKTKGTQMAVSGAMIEAVVLFDNITNFVTGTFDPEDFLWWNQTFTGETNINHWVNTLAFWVMGMGLALFGYNMIKFAISFQNDDTGARVKSWQGAITGGLISALAPIIRIIVWPTDTDRRYGNETRNLTTNTIATGPIISGAFTFIGSAMVLYGAIQIAQAFRTDEAEAKTKGLRWSVAGAMVIAIANVVGAFITF